MTWVRIDDAAPLHPKMLRAGPTALALWLCGLAHCNRHNTDGKIDKDALPALYPSKEWALREMKRAANKLVSLGLWEDKGATWVVHDYADYQSTAMRQQVEVRRAQARDRKRSQRDRERDRKRDTRDVSQRDTRIESESSDRDSGDIRPRYGRDTAEIAQFGSNDSAGLTPMSQHPVPSRPDLISHSERDSVATLTLVGSSSARLTPLVRTQFERRFVAMRGSPPSWSKKNVDLCQTIAIWLEAKGGEPARVLDGLLDGFFREPWAVSKGFPLALLANDPSKFLKPPERQRDVSTGFCAPAPSNAFVPTSPDSVFGPEPKS